MKRTRLAKRQEEKNIRRAIFYIVLTFVLAFILVIVGIPLLIRMAIFLGNIRTSGNLPEKGDTIPPTPPRIVVPFEATNSAQFSLEGFTEPEAKIKLFNSGLSFGEVIADNEGTFSLGGLKLTLGRNEITAVAEDSAGNESQPSIPAVVIYDTTPPDLEITQPEEGKNVSGVENEITIEGKTEEGAALTINDRLVIVGPEGNFSNEYSLDEGENIFIFVAQDKAGNQTEKELKVVYSP